LEAIGIAPNPAHFISRIAWNHVTLFLSNRQ